MPLAVLGAVSADPAPLHVPIGSEVPGFAQAIRFSQRHYQAAIRNEAASPDIVAAKQ